MFVTGVDLFARIYVPSMAKELSCDLKFDEERRNIRIENVTLYEVVTNSDTCEGRGYAVSLGWFTSKADAKAMAKGQGVWGTDADIKEKSKWVILYTIYNLGNEREVAHLVGESVVIEYIDPKIRRKRALEKLTAEDKEALGLSDK